MLEEIAGTNQRAETNVPLLVTEEYDFSVADHNINDIDILLVTEDALEGVRPDQLRESLTLQVPMLLMLTDSRYASFPRQSGCKVWGVIPLDASASELEASLMALSEGLVTIFPSFFPEFAIAESPVLGYSDENEGFPALTGRESEVLQLLAQGLANKQIARSLNISEHTVKFHISSIYTKFGVTNRMEAVRYGLQQGLVML